MAIGSRLLSRLLIPVCLMKADLVITPSESTKSDLLEYFPRYKQKVRVVPLAGDMLSDHLVTPSDEELRNLKDYFLFVGTIEPRKNLVRLLEAYSELPNSLKIKHSLVIAGREGWGHVRFRERIAELGLNQYILHLENSTDVMLAYLYQNAHCLVFSITIRRIRIAYIRISTLWCASNRVKYFVYARSSRWRRFVC